eukprot:gene6588-6816_t
MQGLFVGYHKDAAGYRILVNDNQIIINRDVQFDEYPLRQPTPAAVSSPARPTPDQATAAGHHHEGLQSAGDEQQPDGSDTASDAVPTRATSSGAGNSTDQSRPSRNRLPSTRYPSSEYAANVFEEIVDPETVKEALEGPYREQWLDAIHSELNSIKDSNTWDLCDLPPGKKAIPTKIILKVKRDESRRIEQFKARLVVLGCRQRPGFDYHETYAPVSKYATVRTLFAVAAALDVDLHHLDISTAFLNGELEEEVYV